MLSDIDIARREADNSALSKEAGNGRVLLLSADKDDTSQFSKLMSGFFAAQKLYIPVDCCHLSTDGTESNYMQQGVEVCGGIYLRPEHQEALAQYLLVRNVWL